MSLPHSHSAEPPHQTGETVRFGVPVPDVEQAVVLKAFAWRSRLAAKDVADLCTLLSITHEHRDRLSDWTLHTARIGARKDAARYCTSWSPCSTAVNASTV